MGPKSLFSLSVSSVGHSAAAAVSFILSLTLLSIRQNFFYTFYQKNDAMTKRSRFEDGQQNLWYWRLQCWYQKLCFNGFFSVFMEKNQHYKKNKTNKNELSMRRTKALLPQQQHTSFNKWPLITNDERVVWFCIQRISFVAINELFMSISLTTKETTKKETTTQDGYQNMCFRWMSWIGLVVGVSCVCV